MDTHQDISGSFDGTLFILWGWIAFINYFFLGYMTRVMVATHQMMQGVHILEILLPLLGLAYTIYYILKRKEHVQNQSGISLRYVWIGLVVSLVLVNLIQFNVLQSIHFELQHPIFMVLIAFAITITGGILRFRIVVAGGIAFGILAYVASYFPLQEQLLIEAIAWLLAFVIPGHYLYSKRKK